jgi:hypothetical protein
MAILCCVAKNSLRGTMGVLGMGKDPVGAGTFCPSPMLVFNIPPCWKRLPAWRNVK